MFRVTHNSVPVRGSLTRAKTLFVRYLSLKALIRSHLLSAHLSDSDILQAKTLCRLTEACVSSWKYMRQTNQLCKAQESNSSILIRNDSSDRQHRAET